MVTETKLTSVDGYTIVDVDGVSRIVGPIRSARKVLQRTTIDLVRHATYTCSVHGLDAVGAAAALNYDRASEGEPPFGAFAEELSSWAEENGFVGSAGLGLGAEEAGPTLSATAAKGAEMSAASAAACVPEGAASVVIVSDGEEPALQALLSDATIEADLATALTSNADALIVRGKTGALNHATLEGTNAKTIIGLQPLTTTARGLAVAGRAGAIIVPDFISAAGPTLAALGHSVDDISERTRSLLDSMTGHGVNLFVAACEKAEAHLATMTDTLPFGRPL